MNETATIKQNVARAFNYSEKIEKKAVAVVIKTKQDIIYCYIYIRPIFRMIDDLLNAEKFLAVTNATIYDSQGNTLFRTKFMVLNRDEVSYIIPRKEIQDIKKEKPIAKTR